MKYKITKQQCQDSISGVCSQCGGMLEPIETVDNSGAPTYWCGCIKCSRFSPGVDSKIYTTAKRMVIDRNYKHYSHIMEKDSDSEELKQYKIECQISGACDIIVNVLRIYNQITLQERK